MMEKGREGLIEYEQQCTDLFTDIVDLVRADIDDLTRSTLKALIVLDVHARDCITQLVKEGIDDKEDFSWLA